MRPQRMPGSKKIAQLAIGFAVYRAQHAKRRAGLALNRANQARHEAKLAKAAR